MKNTVKINSVDLINADCLHFIQSLPDDSIDLIVTDPPYFKVKPNGWDNQWKGDEDYHVQLQGIVRPLRVWEVCPGDQSLVVGVVQLNTSYPGRARPFS